MDVDNGGSGIIVYNTIIGEENVWRKPSIFSSNKCALQMPIIYPPTSRFPVDISPDFSTFLNRFFRYFVHSNLIIIVERFDSLTCSLAAITWLEPSSIMNKMKYYAIMDSHF